MTFKFQSSLLEYVGGHALWQKMLNQSGESMLEGVHRKVIVE